MNDIDQDHGGSFMRMNISLPPSVNTIDDANHVETLGKGDFAQSQKTNDDRQIGIHLLLSRLYFELDELPKFTSYGFVRFEIPLHMLYPSQPPTEQASEMKWSMHSHEAP